MKKVSTNEKEMTTHKKGMTKRIAATRTTEQARG